MRDTIAKTIKRLELDYIKFMGIKDFPNYCLTTKELSKSAIDDKGFESVASVNYKADSDTHYLCVSSNLLISSHLLFHEFTHILDTEMYAKQDKIKHAYIYGFTEYHASQIGFLQLLGAKSKNDIISFSMNDKIESFSITTSVLDYITTKQNLAIELFERNEFKTDFATFSTAIGVLHNYWGLRSICEMYAIDYEEVIKNEAFLNVMSSFHFAKLNNLMHGWFDSKKIDECIAVYSTVVNNLIRTYRLL